jgi:hypothetical protein
MKGGRLVGVQAGGWRGGRPEAGAGDRLRDTGQQAAPARHEIQALLYIQISSAVDPEPYPESMGSLDPDPDPGEQKLLTNTEKIC